MLFVGVAGHGNEDRISGRLIQRGALAGDIAAPPVWDPALALARPVADAARRSGFVRAPGNWFGTDQRGAGHPEEVVVEADPGRLLLAELTAAD